LRGSAELPPPLGLTLKLRDGAFIRQQAFADHVGQRQWKAMSSGSTEPSSDSWRDCAPFPAHGCTLRSVLGSPLPAVGKLRLGAASRCHKFLLAHPASRVLQTSELNRSETKLLRLKGIPANLEHGFPISPVGCGISPRDADFDRGLFGGKRSISSRSQLGTERSAEDQESCKKYCCSRQLVGAVYTSLEAADTELRPASGISSVIPLRSVIQER